MAIWNKRNTGKPQLTDNARASIDLIAARIDNVEDGLSGDESLTTVDINGGTIDGTPIGITTPNDGKFTRVDVDNIELDGNTIKSTNTNGDINITPDGDGLCKIKSLGTQLTFKVINIGDWNMDTDGTLTLAHGVTNFKNIRSVDIIIRNDADDTYHKLETVNSGTSTIDGGIDKIDSTSLYLNRRTAGTFDNVTFDSTSYNRGFVYIRYVS
jgi:hypothetical protein